jgi:hypothetical protein
MMNDCSLITILLLIVIIILIFVLTNTSKMSKKENYTGPIYEPGCSFPGDKQAQPAECGTGGYQGYACTTYCNSHCLLSD